MKTKEKKSLTPFEKFQAAQAKIKKSNAAFMKASPARKRVIIARDVLDSIASEKLVMSPGYFLVPRSSNRENYNGSPAVDVIGEVLGDTARETDQIEVCDLFNSEKNKHLESTQCLVCGKGGIFMQYVNRVDNFSVENLGCSQSGPVKAGSAAMNKLNEIFDQTQLDMIEVAFEGHYYSWTNMSLVHTALGAKCLGFAAKYPIHDHLDRIDSDNVTKRMQLVMQNIIKNKGTFIP